MPELLRILREDDVAAPRKGLRLVEPAPTLQPAPVIDIQPYLPLTAPSIEPSVEATPPPVAQSAELSEKEAWWARQAQLFSDIYAGRAAYFKLEWHMLLQDPTEPQSAEIRPQVEAFAKRSIIAYRNKDEDKEGPDTAMTEAETVKSLLADMANALVAFDTLTERYMGVVESFVAPHRSRKNVDIDELRSIGSEKVMKAVAKFNGRKVPYFASYVTRAVQNGFSDAFRSGKAYYQQEPFISDSVASQDARTMPEKLPFLTEDATFPVLRHALMDLEEDEATIIGLRFHEGLRPKEIAQVLGRDVDDVYRITRNAMERLRRRLPGEIEKARQAEALKGTDTITEPRLTVRETIALKKRTVPLGQRFGVTKQPAVVYHNTSVREVDRIGSEPSPEADDLAAA